MYSIMSEIIHPNNRPRYTIHVGTKNVQLACLFMRYGIDNVLADESLGEAWILVADVIDKDAKVITAGMVINNGC
jgi:hypothetical protein